ncbi:MAG: helix-turn-helix domain-containing protein [Lachnospiraceae bacterium]|nr:helix-turn-helix domain-containing protein [Lachnospiraceae bacterium]
MDDVTVTAIDGFPERLAELRNAKGVSGREMSLSLGQAAGYINSIENGKSLPSLTMFFEICEYLEITPYAFFSYTAADSTAEKNKGLSEEDKKTLLALVRKLCE